VAGEREVGVAGEREVGVVGRVGVADREGEVRPGELVQPNRRMISEACMGGRVSVAWATGFVDE